MRFRFIEDRRSDYPVKIMCGIVSPAGYYAWRARRAREPPLTVNSSTISSGFTAIPMAAMVAPASMPS